MPGSAEKTTAYWVATSASVVLAASWVLYALYLVNTEITKQSVYTGEITFFAAVLLAVSCLSIASSVGSILYMAAAGQPTWRRASFWAASALLCSAASFWFTRALLSKV